MNADLARRAAALAHLHRRLGEILALFDGPSCETEAVERALQHCDEAFTRLRECGATPNDVGPAYRRKLEETVRLHAVVQDCIRREFAELGEHMTTARQLQSRLPFYRSEAGASCDVRG